MTITNLPSPSLRRDRTAVTDAYGSARLPASAHDTQPERVDKIPYGRFRNVYLYITEACQLRCQHCYMGERLDRALKMPYESVIETLETWRKMGGSKLTILGGEPTLHPDYVKIIRNAKSLGYEHVITTSNGLSTAAKKFSRMTPSDFSYVQISLDGGSPASHDQVRGSGTFNEALETIGSLCARGFDTRIICTVNRANLSDCLNLLDIADDLGVSLTKFHVFSVIGSGHGAAEWGIEPREWIDFYEKLEQAAKGHTTRVWYQPTYAKRERLAQYARDGYRGCIGRTLDRISIFPDGRAYVCSFLFDTDLHFANMVNGKVVINKESNEFDLFAGVLRNASCGSCKDGSACMGGCPAEELIMGSASCAADPDILPVCRLWKADVPTGS